MARILLFFMVLSTFAACSTEQFVASAGQVAKPHLIKLNVKSGGNT